LLIFFAKSSEYTVRGAGSPRREASERVEAMVTERGSINSASMRQDLEAGRRTEAAAILGDMLRRAKGFGIATPLMRAAYAHLQVHENRLKRQTSG
jgi:2-dehydropantoate 2-reductase